MQFSGKVCVVTGGAAGIGRATAMEMAKRGAAVVVSDIDDERGTEIIEEIQASGGQGHYVHADMRSGDEIKSLIDTAVDRFGRLDILHNNAGIHETSISGETSLETISEEVWDLVMDVNLKSVWLCSKFAAPYMRRSGGGAIVNAGSTSTFVGYPNGPAYCSTKGAIAQLTKCMAIEWASDNIRVNCYCPGATDTSMVSRYVDAADDMEAILKTLTGSHLIKRLGRPEEIARLVCFLVSEDASFITGASYLIDGGSLAWRGCDV